MRGRTIKLFLADGVPTGIIAAEVMNWTGKIYVVPRVQLAQLRRRDDTQRSGVYMLVGTDPDAPLRQRVYIGESDNVIGRVPQHDRDDSKEFYERAVIVLSKDEQLTKAHARYLENRLIALSKANGSANLTNDTRGSSDVRLPESDVADMESFLDQVQMVLPVLGFGFTQPRVDVAALRARAIADATRAVEDGREAAELTHVSPVFEISVVGASGRAQEVGGQFFLLKGSTARKQGVPTWTSYKALREQLVEDGKLVEHPDDPNYYVAPEDIPLSSPSAGAAIVAGRNMNGRQLWKVEGTGQTYQEWFDGHLPPDDEEG